MKKIMSLILIGMFILTFGIISAKTAISGEISGANVDDFIIGANVTVSCAHGVYTNIMTDVSSVTGEYYVEFDERGNLGCNDGDIVTVTAEKDGQIGIRSDVVKDDMIGTWDIAIINVPLVPEFGIIIGMLTMVSAVGIFFFVRRD